MIRQRKCTVCGRRVKTSRYTLKADYTITGAKVHVDADGHLQCILDLAAELQSREKAGREQA